MADRAVSHAALHTEAPLAAASAAEIWRMVVPWLGYGFLAASGVLGLFTASAATDDPTYAAGLGTFMLAIVIIVMRMKRQLDGREIGFLLAVSVTSVEALFVSIAVLGVLGLVGLVLAATVGGSLYGIGLALFIICAAFILSDIKRYFDALERHG